MRATSEGLGDRGRAAILDLSVMRDSVALEWDLVVSIIGTSDYATIQGWYSAATNQVDRIQIADGDHINAGNVESLCSAMAAFSPPPLGQTTLDSTRASALAAAWR